MPTRVLTLFLSCLLLCVCLPGCKKDDGSGKSFRFPLAGEPRQLDPQVSADSASVTLTAALFEGLTRPDENGNPVPGAAEWSVSADGLIYTFKLKTSFWSTLSKTPFAEPIPVTAADFVFGMTRAVLPATRSETASRLFGIVNARAVYEGKQPASALGVQAVDDKTLTIRLTAPDENFPARLFEAPFMPCHAPFFEYTAGRYGLEKDYILCNGPFSLIAWNHDLSLLLGKNEGYHAAASIAPDTVRYVIVSLADNGNALLSDMLDAARLRPDQLDAAAEKGIQITALSDTVHYLWINNRLPSLSASGVRRALRDAIEWEVIYAQLDAAYHIPAKGYVPPDALIGTEHYRTESNAQTYSSKGTAAQADLLAGLAGVSLTAMPTLTVLCADDAYSVNLAKYILQSWQKNLHLYFTPEPIPAAQLAARVQVGNYQLAIAPFTGNGRTVMENLGAMTSDAPTGNYARYKSDEYDNMYAKAMMNPASRAQWEALEQKLAEDCPAIPLCFVKRFFGSAADTTGIRIQGFGEPVDFSQAKRP